jgi:hypothetical protein
MHLRVPIKELVIGCLIALTLWALIPFSLWWFTGRSVNKSGPTGDTFGGASALFSGLAFASAFAVFRAQRDAERRERTIRFFERVTDPLGLRKFSRYFENPEGQDSREGLEEMKFGLVNFLAVLEAGEMDTELAKVLMAGPLIAWCNVILLTEKVWPPQLKRPKELGDVRNILEALCSHLQIEPPTSVDRVASS